jgi:hypothetical protein
MPGALFACGRRVVAAWIRAAGGRDDYQVADRVAVNYCYFLQSAGQRWRELGLRLLVLVMRLALGDQQRVLLPVEESPTKRYGPQVQSAGIRRDPTPGANGGRETWRREKISSVRSP